MLRDSEVRMVKAAGLVQQVGLFSSCRSVRHTRMLLVAWCSCLHRGCGRRVGGKLSCVPIEGSCFPTARFSAA